MHGFSDSMFVRTARPEDIVNLILLDTGNMIWKTSTAAIGACPAFNHFMMWPDIDKAPITITATAAMINDFALNVLPLIEEHVQTSVTHDADRANGRSAWVIDTMNRLAEGASLSEVMATPKREVNNKIIERVNIAHAEVVEAMKAFIARHNEPIEA